MRTTLPRAKWIVSIVDPAEAGFLIGNEQRCPRLCLGWAR
jgi:hypothetical protein